MNIKNVKTFQGERFIRVKKAHNNNNIIIMIIIIIIIIIMDIFTRMKGSA